MPDRCASEVAVVHGFSLRLLVFNPPDQLVLCFSQGTIQVRVLSNRYQRRKAGQARAQGDALLLAVAILQGDVDNHILGIPPSEVWS